MARFPSFCLLALVALTTCAEAYKKGDGTAYSGNGQKNKTGFNACQFGKLDSKWEKYYAALPNHKFDKDSDCGRCIKVRGAFDGAPDEWTVVMVVDSCASCEGDNDIDLSSDAFEEATGYSWDRKTVEWEWTSCGDRKMRKMLQH